MSLHVKPPENLLFVFPTGGRSIAGATAAARNRTKAEGRVSTAAVDGLHDVVAAKRQRAKGLAAAGRFTLINVRSWTAEGERIEIGETARVAIHDERAAVNVRLHALSTYDRLHDDQGGDDDDIF